MDMALTFRLKDHSISASGKTINNIIKAKKYGPTEHNLRAYMQTVKKMARENFCGLMALLLKAISLIMSYKVKAFTNGLTIEYLRANGRIIKCMEKEYLLGLTAVSILDNIKMIRKKGMVFLLGQIKEFMTVIGKAESKME